VHSLPFSERPLPQFERTGHACLQPRYKIPCVGSERMSTDPDTMSRSIVPDLILDHFPPEILYGSSRFNEIVSLQDSRSCRQVYPFETPGDICLEGMHLETRSQQRHLSNRPGEQKSVQWSRNGRGVIVGQCSCCCSTHLHMACLVVWWGVGGPSRTAKPHPTKL
jgi:hypothetical protein